jgi:hypothetical protein
MADPLDEGVYEECRQLCLRWEYSSPGQIGGFGYVRRTIGIWAITVGTAQSFKRLSMGLGHATLDDKIVSD